MADRPTALHLGVLSGTSADGLDFAALEFSTRGPEAPWIFRSGRSYPYPPHLKEPFRRLTEDPEVRLEEVLAFDHQLGIALAEATLEFLDETKIPASMVRGLGHHGQTLYHYPPDGRGAGSMQLGSPYLLAEVSGIPVVHGFRSHDMALGGQGAPLAPHLDEVLIPEEFRPCLVLNLGGIANWTFLPKNPGESGLAFDSGPANSWMDAACRAYKAPEPFDRDAALAAAGSIHPGLVAAALQDPYFSKVPPKTTGLEVFGRRGLESLLARLKLSVGEDPRTGSGERISLEDLLRSLAEVSLRSFRDSLEWLPETPKSFLMTGGGRENPVLARGIRSILEGAEELDPDTLGIPSEFKEAALFALLSHRWFERRAHPPGYTGARRPAVLGSLIPRPERDLFEGTPIGPGCPGWKPTSGSSS